MRFRESPPQFPTDHLVLHPASKQSVFRTKSWPRFRLERPSTLPESPPSFCCNQYPLPACLFVPVASVLAAVSRHSRLAPRPPDKRAVDLPETQTLALGHNKGGWTPILLCCATAVQHSNANAVEPAATGEGAAASFACVWVLAALGDDSAAGATAEQRQYGDGGGSLLPGTLPSPNTKLGQLKASGGRFGSVIPVAFENQCLMTVSFGQARRPRYPTNSTPSWRRRRRRPPPPPLPPRAPHGSAALLSPIT